MAARPQTRNLRPPPVGLRIQMFPDFGEGVPRTAGPVGRLAGQGLVGAMKLLNRPGSIRIPMVN